MISLSHEIHPDDRRIVRSDESTNFQVFLRQAPVGEVLAEAFSNEERIARQCSSLANVECEDGPYPGLRPGRKAPGQIRAKYEAKEDKLKYTFVFLLSISFSHSHSVLPFGSVEERALEALGAVDEGHHEDVGQRGVDGHEDLVARGERGWGLRYRGRHLAPYEVIASVRRGWLSVC